MQRPICSHKYFLEDLTCFSALVPTNSNKMSTASDTERPTEKISMLCVTAFHDIGRGSWEGSLRHLRRTNEEYLSWFANLVKLPMDLVCFCDEPAATLVRERTGFKNIYPYLEQDTLFRHVEREKEIMNSPSYQKHTGYHPTKPENTIAEYNMVNHSKTSIVRRASVMFPQYSHYAWIDFGYLREEIIPNYIDWKPVATDKIVYASLREMELSTLQVFHDPDSPIQGSMFVLPKDLAAWYEKTYEVALLEYQDANIADDDQVLAQQVMQRYPDFFKLTIFPHWFELLRICFK